MDEIYFKYFTHYRMIILGFKACVYLILNVVLLIVIYYIKNP